LPLIKPHQLKIHYVLVDPPWGGSKEEYGQDIIIAKAQPPTTPWGIAEECRLKTGKIPSHLQPRVGFNLRIALLYCGVMVIG
jgi:hypothetical protein